MHMDLVRSFLIILQVSVCQLWASSPGITIRALRGSCVVIPCTFTSREPRGPISIIQWWKRKGGEKQGQIIYGNAKSSAAVEGYRDRTAFLGDVDNGTCSLQINNVRSEDTARYYPWIEPITSTERLHSLHVSDSPEELSVSDPGVMTEGRSVVITCSAVHTCPPRPPSLTWDRHRGNASVHHEDLRDGRWRAVSKINYSSSSEDHGKSLQCMATYPENITSTKSITFNITYPPKNTAVVVSGAAVVKQGDNVTLNCSAIGNPAVFNYSWYEGQQKAPLQNQKQQMTLTNIRCHSGPYYCTAQNELGHGESAPLDLKIQCLPESPHTEVRPACSLSHCQGSGPDAPKGTRVDASAKDLTLGEIMKLTCTTNGSNPAVANYTWYRNGIQIENQAKNTLEVKKMTMDDYGDYHCVAHNEAGNSSSAPVTVKAISDTSSGFPLVPVAGVAAGALFILTLLFIFVFVRRKKTLKTAVPAQSAASDSTTREELVYSTVNHSKRSLRQKRTVSCDDSVTYAAVARSSESKTPGGSTAMNSVKKPARPPKNKEKEEELVYATGLTFQPPRRNLEMPIDDFVEYAAVRR